MTEPMTSVNGIISDAVSQTNVLNVGQAPAMAMAQLYQNLAQATALATMNSVYAQQQTNMAFQAATVLAVQTLLSRR